MRTAAKIRAIGLAIERYRPRFDALGIDADRVLLETLWREDAEQQPKGKFGNKRPGIPCGKGYISWRKKCGDKGKVAIAKERLKGTAEGKAYADRIRKFKGLEKVQGSGKGTINGMPEIPRVEKEILDRLEGAKGSHVGIVKDGLDMSRGFLKDIENFDMERIENINKRANALHQDSELIQAAKTSYMETKEYKAQEKAMLGNQEEWRSLQRKSDEAYEAYSREPRSSPKRDEYRNNWKRIETARKSQQRKMQSDSTKRKDLANEAVREYIDNLPQSKALRKELLEAVKPAEQFKEKLIASSGFSEQQAADFAAKIKIPSAKVDSMVRKELRDFSMMTSGAATTLKQIKVSKKRAHAEKDTGLATYGGQGKYQTLWHEMSHHLEFSDPVKLSAAADWRDSRSKSDKPVSLRRITGNNKYGKNEVAVVDNFITPYAGKVYPPSSEATEVISVGMQHFARPDLMMRLAKKDPEHFALMVGMLRNK
jgi:hypothetical protein